VVVSAEQAEDLQKKELSIIKQLFCEKIGLDEDLSELLIEAGFTQAHELAYVDQQDFYDLGFDDDIINYLRDKAQEYLLAQVAAPEITQELKTVPGLTKEWLELLIKANICSTEDLAELAIPDLMDILPCTSEEAGALIMAARSVWFD
jgi:N utilization substance protein A